MTEDNSSKLDKSVNVDVKSDKPELKLVPSIKVHSTPKKPAPPQVTFTRQELNEILRVYGRFVAEGEWRDYAMDFQKDRAVFSIFRRSAEMPLYRIEKDPKLARKQGAFSVMNTAGMILKRGHELKQVLKVLEPKRHLRVVDA